MAQNEDCTNIWRHFVVILCYSCEGALTLESTTQSGYFLMSVCVCDVVVGSCLFFLSLSSVTWHTGWLSHMPWGRVTKLTLGTGRFLEGQTWSCGYSMIRSWLSLDSLSFRYIPHKTLNTWKRDQSHSGSFACFSPLNANCLYCTLLLTMFQSMPYVFQSMFSIDSNRIWNSSCRDCPEISNLSRCWLMQPLLMYDCMLVS